MFAGTRGMAVMVVALLGAACSHGNAAQRTSAQAPPRSAAAEAAPSGDMSAGGMSSGKMAAMCPMAVPGTEVSAADTAGGETLTFSTSQADQVSDLRSRVHAMADMHNRHHASGQGGMAMSGRGGMGMSGMSGQGDTGTSGQGQRGMGGMQGHEHGAMMGGDTGSRAGMSHTMPPPSTAAVEDTDTGARLVVAPKDPAQLAQLQSGVRAHADMMKSGRCAMMDGGARAQ